MELYLLRHADAETVAQSDDERFLSEKGMQQSQRVARFCEAHEIKPDIIFSSPLRRTHQTAAIVADKLRVELKTVRWLGCGAQASDMLAQIREYRNLPSLMLVGHEPDLGLFTAFMIGTGHGENIHVRKGALIKLSVAEFAEAGASLEFLLPPKLL